jgi:hypothetical protein
MFAAEFEPAAGPRRRREPRASAAIDAQLDSAGIGRALCRVLDFSITGARIEIYSELERGALIWLALPTVGRRAARVVWSRDFEAGLEFSKPLSAKALKALTAQ